MIDGSSWRIAVLVVLLLAPFAAAAPPAPILTTPSPTDGQEITDFAMEPSGQYAAAVVSVDTASVGSGLPLGTNPTPTKADVYSCDFAPATSPGSAQNCLSGRQTYEPTNAQRAIQSIAATSFPLSGGLTARFAVGGPHNVVSFWSSTQPSSPRLSARAVGPGGDEAVTDVAITPNGTRVIAATEPALSATGGQGKIIVYEATTSLQEKWNFTVTDGNGQTGGTRVRAMDHARTGRYLVVGTTPASGASSGAILFFDASVNARPSPIPGRDSIEGSVTDLELSDNGNALIVGATSGIYYYELPAGLPDANRLPWGRNPSGSGASAVAISRDGERFAAAFGDTVHFYRHINDSRVAEEIGQGYSTGSPVTDLSYDGKGRLLVAISGTRVFGFAPNVTEPIWSFDATQAQFGGLDGPLKKVEVSEGAERVVVAGKTRVMPYATRVAATLVSTSDTTMTATPGSTTRLALRATNTGSLEDELYFVVSRPHTGPQPWGGLNPEPVALLPDSSNTQGWSLVNLTIDVPPGHQPGTFPVTIDVRSRALQNASRDTPLATLRIDFVIPRSVQLAVDVEAETLSIVKGTQRLLPVTIKNVGNADGVVNLSIDQDTSRGSPWSARLDESQISLAAGSERTLELEINAPADAADGERNALTIVAREGAYQVTRTLTVFVDPEWGVTLEASNATLEFTARAPQVITLSVHNTGNTADKYNLTHAFEPPVAANDWKVTIAQAATDVPAGQRRNVGVTIEPLSAVPRAATLTLRAVSQSLLADAEDTEGVNLLFTEPVEEENDESFLPAPSPVLIVLVALAVALLAGRARGGRQ